MFKSFPALGAIGGTLISIITNPLHIVEVFLYAAVGAAAGELVKRLIQKRWPKKD